jgi:hypothetical protein
MAKRKYKGVLPPLNEPWSAEDCFVAIRMMGVKNPLDPASWAEAIAAAEDRMMFGGDERYVH